MANIKNFGLVGVGSDVQFGKSGPRLINETGIFKFKKADGIALADAHFANVTADELKSGVGKLVTVDLNGKLIMGADIESLATDLEMAAAVKVEKDRAEAAELAITQAAATEKLARIAAEEAIAALVQAEEERAIAEEARIEGLITAAGGDTTQAIADAIAAEVTRANAADAVIAGLVADEQARAEAAEQALADAAAEETIARVAAEKVINDALLAEVGRATGAESDIRAEFAAADTLLRNRIDTAIAGLTWENPVKQMVADLVARDALTLVTGDRIFVEADKTIYTKTADGFTSEAMVQGAAFFDKETTVPYVFNGIDMVQFNGAAGLTAGLGLILNGNTMDLDLAPTGGLKFFPDATNPNNTVGINLADTSLQLADEVDGEGNPVVGLRLSTALQTEIGSLRTDLTAEAAAARLAEGTLTTNLAAEVTRATGAEEALATRMTAVEGKNTAQDGRLDALEAKTGADSALLQAEVDFMEAALGLDVDGKLVAFAGTTYVAANDTFASAITKIDVALKAMDDAYKAADTATLNLAKAYTDQREEVIMTYIDGQITLVNEAIEAALVTAAADATTKAATAKAEAITAANAYTDQKVADQIGSANAARAVYASFDGADAVVGLVKGFVHRIKVYVTTAGATDSLIQVGTGTVNGQLATTADVDSSTAGLYTVEVNEVFATPTELKVFVGGAAAGKVVVEYLA